MKFLFYGRFWEVMNMNIEWLPLNLFISVNTISFIVSIIDKDLRNHIKIGNCNILFKILCSIIMGVIFGSSSAFVILIVYCFSNL